MSIFLCVLQRKDLLCTCICMCTYIGGTSAKSQAIFYDSIWSSALSQMKLFHIQDCTKIFVMVLHCGLWRNDTRNAVWSVLCCCSGLRHLNMIFFRYYFILILTLLSRLLHSSVNDATWNSPPRDYNLLIFSQLLKIRSLLLYFSSPECKIL